MNTIKIVVLTLVPFILFVSFVILWTLPDKTRQRIRSRRRRLTRRFGSKVTRLRRMIWSWIKWPFTAIYRFIAGPIKGAIHSDILRGRFNPFTWNVLFRPTVSAIAGLFAAGLLKTVFWSLNMMNWLSVDPIGLYIFTSVALLFFLFIVRPETDKEGNSVVEIVPETDYGALVTFIGMPTFFIRKTGDYSWIGKRLWLDRSRKPFIGVIDPAMKGVSPNALELGFIPLGDITFPVWDSAHADTKLLRTTITRPAKNRAPITASLTLIGDFTHPRRWLKATDPALDIGDRARQELQELIETVIDTDVAALQPKMQDYLFGSRLVTSFITKSSGGFKVGSMIRDANGLVMVDVVDDDTISDEEVKQIFRQKLLEEADSGMLTAVQRTKTLDDGSKIKEASVTILRVSNPLSQATTARGLNMHRVTFGDVILSKKVSDAGEQASAEFDERVAQLASAKTIKEARKLMKPTESELENPELFQLTTALAAAADDKNGNVKVVMVPGASRLGSAIVAAGQQIGDTKK